MAATPALPCPVLGALDRRATPVRLFIRDDDAGWADEALMALLAVTDAAEVPIDLAVIPDALTPALARQLRRLPAQVGLHQHGRAHTNHEPADRRKCEFGAARSAAQQRADLSEGRQRLRQLLDDRLDNGFTPPWNRLGAPTPALLAELGFDWLSRDAGAARQTPQQALPELPVHTDFTRLWAQGPDAVARHLADQVSEQTSEQATVGLMLHHAVMDEPQRQWLGQALARWRGHPMARWLSMADALAADRPGQPEPAPVAQTR